MEEFNDRAYDAWRTRHWTDEPEPDFPEIDDPRVVDAWEEAEDGSDEYPLPRYARVRVKFKPWKDDDYTEELSYYDYLEEGLRGKQRRNNYGKRKYNNNPE
jgi:hypothetical protein